MIHSKGHGCFICFGCLCFKVGWIWGINGCLDDLRVCELHSLMDLRIVQEDYEELEGS